MIRRLSLLFLSLLTAALLHACTGSRGAGAPIPHRSDSGRFRDVAVESGIGAFQHSDGGSGRKFFAEQVGGGVAIFDYDGDGWPDIYLCSGVALPGYKGPPCGNRLFRNKHNGTFEDVTEKAGVAGPAAPGVIFRRRPQRRDGGTADAAGPAGAGGGQR